MVEKVPAAKAHTGKDTPMRETENKLQKNPGSFKTIASNHMSDSGSTDSELSSVAEKIYSRAVSPGEAQGGEDALRKR